MPPLICSAALLCVLAHPNPSKPPAVTVERPVIVRQAPAPAPLDSARGRQSATSTATPGRGFFFSWGYNSDVYTKSDLHFSQPSLNNDFTLVAVKARDSEGWTDGIFSHSLTVPQYDVRFGFFFNEKWGIELAHDHIKWIVVQDQTVRMTGTLDGAAVDADVKLTPDVLRYQLNNGANPLFINLIRRVRLAGEPGRTGHVAFLAKAGAGFANPHTENAVFDQPNEKGFQFFHGWNVDAAAALRIHFFKPLYVEFEDKLLYARYWGIKVDQGTARQSLKANEFSFSFGWAF